MDVVPPAAAANLAPDSDGYLWVLQDKFHESFCQDLSDDDALVMAVTQKAPLASTFGDTVTAPAWRVKPSWYQVSTQDRMIHPDNERRMAQRINPRKIIELDASHASLASQAAAVAVPSRQATTVSSRNAGRVMRMETVSPALGQATHFPVFRGGDALYTLHARYTRCMEQVRAQPFPMGSEAFNNLEYYHSYLSNGLPLRASVYRR